MEITIRDQIIDYLTRNRVSTTEVADCLGKKGALSGIMPCNQGYYKTGVISWVYAYDESNWPLHEQIQDLEDDSIVFVDTYSCGERAILGELVSKYLLLYRQSRAIIVNGKVRDAAALLRQRWPIWSYGFTPVGCFNKEPENQPNGEWVLSHRELYDGSIAVCDDCGVVIIYKDEISEDFLKRLYYIENQEDIWFDRLDHYKESTFEIVCQKNYLNDETYMSIRKRNNHE